MVRQNDLNVAKMYLGVKLDSFIENFTFALHQTIVLTYTIFS